MRRPTNNLQKIADRIRKTFTVRDAAREKTLPLCRETIRHCSLAIRAIHRQEFDQAMKSLMTAQGLLCDIADAVKNFPELGQMGFVRDAQKEFAEGSATFALVTGRKIPTPEELNVDPAAYLNGIGEAVGELRRYLLDSMRKGDLSQGEALLGSMDDIYSVLVTIDFPDAITGSLRHTTDNVRGILEKTRSDLTLAMGQKELERKLAGVPVKKTSARRRKSTS